MLSGKEKNVWWSPFEWRYPNNDISDNMFALLREYHEDYGSVRSP